MTDEGKGITGGYDCADQPKIRSPEFCKHMDLELRGRMVHFVNENDLCAKNTT